MFKKLKDKITEEVKSSPQRIQQFTQSVTEKIQNTTNDDNLFTITDDDSPTNLNMEPGFSNVALTSTNLDRPRRTSVSSLASDISFLPRYESNMNAYHLQSDLDISASEMEDNMSSASSQVGNISKEQMYSAFQKAQMRYHKYRGRYTDLANHYKELERDNTKMKTVLVDTQDKAIRRMTELKEQCSLEQKAKAHLESALRLELDEKEYVIKTLKTKIDLLKNGTRDENLIELNNKKGEDQENLELLTKYLNDARVEIENLNGKIQEHKANKIILDSKSMEYKQKISDLERTLLERNKEIENFSVREKENNIKIAEKKMQLHIEIQDKDVEIANLKMECEKLKQNINLLDTKERSNKSENLKLQNTKLIEKIEALNQKCKNNESELLKLEQYKIEIKNLNDTNKSLKDDNEKFLQEKNQYEDRKHLKEEYELLQIKYDEIQNEYEDNIRKISIIQADKETLSSKLGEYEKVSVENKALKQKVTDLEEEIKEIKQENQNLTQCNNERNGKLQELNNIKENLEKNVQDLELKMKESTDNLEKDRLDMKQSLIQLETKIKDKLTIDFAAKEDKLKKEFETRVQEITSNNLTMKELQMKLLERENELEKLIETMSCLEEELANSKANYTEIVSSQLELISENNENMHKVKTFTREIEELQKENVSKSITIKMLNEEMELFQQVSTDQQNKICGLEKEYESLSIEREEISNQYKQLQTNFDKLSLEFKERQLVVEKLQKEMEEKQSTEDNLITLKANTEANTKQLKEENDKLMQDIQSTNSKLVALQKNSAAIQETLEETQNELHQFKVEHDKIKDIQQTALNEKKAIETLLEESKQRQQTLLDDLETKHCEISELHVTISELKELRKETITQNEEIVNLRKLHEEVQRELQQSKDGNDEELKKVTNLLEDTKTNENNLRHELEKLHKLLAEKQEILMINQQNLAEKEQRLDEQQERLSDVDNLNRQIIELQEWETKYKNLLDENSNLKGQMAQVNELQDKLQIVHKEVELLNAENLNVSGSNKDLLQMVDKYTNEIETLKVKLKQLTEEYDRMTTNKNFSEQNLLKLQENYDNLQKEVQELGRNEMELNKRHEETLKSNHNKYVAELNELNARNQLLETDYKTTVEESEKLVINLEEVKLRLINVEEQLTQLNETNAKLLEEREQLQNLKNTIENQDDKDVEKRELEKQLNELEMHFNEINHERQLLLDEIQELKTAPINLTNNEDNLEIARLNEKIQQYKSLDLTNRTSIEFYENEMQKLRNKNEKLSRKLDETLVTLNHCAELSNSTEVEYLKNVLYNYMLGKESLVLARVIAAVCKFDPEQTETILQREQHKQTLFGQFGIL